MSMTFSTCSSPGCHNFSNGAAQFGLVGSSCQLSKASDLGNSFGEGIVLGAGIGFAGRGCSRQARQKGVKTL